MQFKVKCIMQKIYTSGSGNVVLGKCLQNIHDAWQMPDEDRSK